MEVRVDYEILSNGVRAVCADLPSLRALGVTKEEAPGNLIPLLQEQYQARAESVREVTMVRMDADDPNQPDGNKALPNGLLRSLATKHKPPSSWYEEEIVF